MEQTNRKVIASDYFLDALGDPDLALKIRERQPENLAAFRIASQLKVWNRDSNRLHEAAKGAQNKENEPKDTKKL